MVEFIHFLFQHQKTNKYAFQNNLGENLNNIFKYLSGDEFIDYLEKLTGITGIIRNDLKFNKLVQTNSNPDYIKGFRTNIASFLAIKETNSGVNKLTYIFHFLKDDDIIKIISAPLSTTTQEVVKIYTNTLLNFDKQKYDEFSTGNKKVLFSEFKNWNGNSIESLLKDDYEFSQLIKSTVDTF